MLTQILKDPVSGQEIRSLGREELKEMSKSDCCKAPVVFADTFQCENCGAEVK